MFDSFKMTKKTVIVKNGEVFITEEKRDLTQEQYEKISRAAGENILEGMQKAFDEIDSVVQTPVVKGPGFVDRLRSLFSRKKPS